MRMFCCVVKREDMANPPKSAFLTKFHPDSLSLCLVLFLLLTFSQAAKNTNHQHEHTIEVASLFPPSVCSPPGKQALKSKASLQLVHRHGPCAEDGQNSANHSDILGRDRARVSFIQAKLSKGREDSKQMETASEVLPVKDGNGFDSGNYVVTVGLGTPKKDLSLVFDTGSDLTWTQCQPCVKTCYSQKDPIFDPNKSSSYSNVSCSSPLCSSLVSATGNAGICSSTSCVYGIQYGDTSFSVGFFAKEKLTLTESAVFDEFLFGCGEDDQGYFGKVAGLLGLGRDKLSLPSQTASAFHKIFSYCLPTPSSSSGHLTFGSSISRSVRFTPLSSISAKTSFYGLDISGISVAGVKLSIPISVFSTAGTIIDSGTVVTRLPPKAYAALRAAFRSKMRRYPSAPALSILDTCYNLSKFKTVKVPKISISFKGAVIVDIHPNGILFGTKTSQVCLAFAGNAADRSVGILGNLQQQTLEIVYDGAHGRVGFSPGGCD